MISYINFYFSSFNEICFIKLFLFNWILNSFIILDYSIIIIYQLIFYDYINPFLYLSIISLFYTQKINIINIIRKRIDDIHLKFKLL